MMINGCSLRVSMRTKPGSQSTGSLWSNDRIGMNKLYTNFFHSEKKNYLLVSLLRLLNEKNCLKNFITFSNFGCNL